MLRTLVVDVVQGVQPQGVEVVLAQPEEGVLDEEVADAVAVGLVVIEGVAPGGSILAGEVRAEIPQIVALRTQVVVDDVENRGHALAMDGIDQRLEAGRAAVGILDRIGIDAVIAPVAVSWELCYRHQLDRRDAELTQRDQSRKDGLERAFRREGPHVKLVDDHIFQREPLPARIGPRESRVVDHLAGAVNSLRLKLRGRVRPLGARFQQIPVPAPRRHLVHDGPPVAGLVFLQREIALARARRFATRAAATAEPTRRIRTGCCPGIVHRFGSKLCSQEEDTDEHGRTPTFTDFSVCVGPCSSVFVRAFPFLSTCGAGSARSRNGLPL